ncbi:DUF3466 family protein [Rheinheimera baltica]|uniref:DUF3466 family protein n=1 Tax=Rheinheimera baltica TaxID=67576 RepID=UPI00040EA91D|nr:DUF3466 family protein [Rheinheimera baltica]
MKLSRISLALLPLLSLCSVQAAVYNVVEVGNVPELKSTYASGINDSGDTVFNGAIKVQRGTTSSGAPLYDYTYFNYPVDLDAIDFENSIIQAFFTDEQLADINSGNITADIQSILLSNNLALQVIGNAIGYVKTGTEQAQNFTLRDTAMARANSEYIYDINSAGIAVGMATSTFTKQSFTPVAEDDATTEPETVEIWVPDLPYLSGVAVVSGEPLVLPPPYQDFGGGMSSARAISNSGFIAGYGSIGLVDEASELLETNCNGESQPINSCFYGQYTSDLRTPGTRGQPLTSFGYTQRGLIWQIEGSNISAPTVLGFLGEKNTQLEHSKEGALAINYFSQALAVNNSGIAVGVSSYTDEDKPYFTNEVYRTTHATLFVENEALPMVDADSWLTSTSVGINNNNIAVGYASKVINGNTRNKMFYYDYSTNTTSFITGFFDSSGTVPRAINDDNVIVGSAEVIASGTTTRRIHGFMYDVGSDNFVDLNTLIGCNSPYTIVEGRDINSNGTIVATALVNRDTRDLLGNVVVDAQGNPEKEVVTTVVTLQPIANGEVDVCNTGESEYERKGGSLGVWTFLFGGALIWWRRRKY